MRDNSARAVALMVLGPLMLTTMLWAASGLNLVAAAIRHLWWSVAVIATALGGA